MNVVVTGATGFVGTPLVRELLAAGHTVTALTRDVQRAVRRLPARCTVQSWNPEQALDPSALRGADAIVHLAGEGIAEARWTAARRRGIRNSRVDTSLALVRVLGQLDASVRPRVLVSASAIGWYGDRGDTRLDEQSAPGTGFLADVCRDWEGAVFAAQALNVRTVAVRIGVVLGRDGGALKPLLPLFRLGLGGRVGSGRQWLSWIHLSDLVGLLRHVVENPRAAGLVNGVAPEPVTNAAFTAKLGRVLHRPAVLPVPAMALRAVLGEMSSVLLASQRVEPTAARQLGYSFQYPTLRSALDDLCADHSQELLVEQRLARLPERVFPFFADPKNLERITADFLRFKVLGTTTDQIGDGTLINYALRLHGIPLLRRDPARAGHFVMHSISKRFIQASTLDDYPVALYAELLRDPTSSFSGSSAPSRWMIGEGIDNTQPAGVPVAIRSPPMLLISRGLDSHLAFRHI